MSTVLALERVGATMVRDSFRTRDAVKQALVAPGLLEEVSPDDLNLKNLGIETASETGPQAVPFTVTGRSDPSFPGVCLLPWSRVLYALDPVCASQKRC